MKEIYCDVSIIGGGLIGSITAYTLSNLGIAIAIHERNPAFKEKKY
jgi:2-polyprenyl-6-methoxyphenol hydroxylase and related FAD-dependent oxidoreductases